MSRAHSIAPPLVLVLAVGTAVAAAAHRPTFAALRAVVGDGDAKGRTTYQVPNGWGPDDAILRAFVPRAAGLGQSVAFEPADTSPFRDARWHESWLAEPDDFPPFTNTLTAAELCDRVIRSGYATGAAACRKRVTGAAEAGAVSFVVPARRLELSFSMDNGSGAATEEIAAGTRIRLKAVQLRAHHRGVPPARTGDRATGGLTMLEREVLAELGPGPFRRVYMTRGSTMHLYPAGRALPALQGRRDLVVGVDADGLHAEFRRAVDQLAGGPAPSNDLGLAPTAARPGIHTSSIAQGADLKFVYGAIAW